jgi:hypothetical protein
VRGRQGGLQRGEPRREAGQLLLHRLHLLRRVAQPTHSCGELRVRLLPRLRGSRRLGLVRAVDRLGVPGLVHLRVGPLRRLAVGQRGLQLCQQHRVVLVGHRRQDQVDVALHQRPLLLHRAEVPGGGRCGLAGLAAGLVPAPQPTAQGDCTDAPSAQGREPGRAGEDVPAGVGGRLAQDRLRTDGRLVGPVRG